MSEETATEEDGQDPSMEDILTNIRDILTEEEAEMATAKTASEPGPDLSPDPDLSLDPDLGPDPEPGPHPEPGPDPDPGSGSDPDPAPRSDPETFFNEEPEPGTTFKPEPAPMPPALEAMLELTPDMVAREVMSEPTSRASTDVLSELAAAILDRRDMAVDSSSRDMTLEGIVREMLKPILREWLDRNLPYLIERLVKREIDLMVNRAERLED